MFPDQEGGIWTRDEITGHWYLHRFYRHQPDRNLSHPKVRDEIAKIVGFWLHLGLDGFRVDGIPQLLTLAQGDDIVPIPGTRRIARLEENIQAADLVLSADDLAQIKQVLPDGAFGARYAGNMVPTWI